MLGAVDDRTVIAARRRAPWLLLLAVAGCPSAAKRPPAMTAAPAPEPTLSFAMESRGRVASDEPYFDGCDTLPAYGSAELTTLTAPATLAAMTGSTVPSAQRLAQVSDYRAQLAVLARHYGGTCGLPREYLIVTATAFEAAARAAPLFDQALAAISDRDPSYADHEAGRAEFRAECAAAVRAFAWTLPDVDLQAPLPEVADRLGHALAQLRAALPPTTIDPGVELLDLPDDNPHRQAVRAAIVGALR